VYGGDSNEEEFSAYMHDDYRYGFMERLLQWAVDCGVEFAQGVEIVSDNSGDWGMELVQPKEGGTPLLTIPSQVILSSEVYAGSSLYGWMKQNVADPYWLPECLLGIRLLEELSKGLYSPWCVWLESLPTTFTTALYWDSFERSQVQRIAPKFLEQHLKQWQTFSTLVKELSRDSEDLISKDFRKWLRSQEDISSASKWAFSIVMTRSWRAPDGKEATIVPIGDMCNHDSLEANVRPCLREKGGSLQLILTKDTDCSEERPSGIFLSYGLSHHPARFLVNFGFCDVSAPLIEVHIDTYLAQKGLPPLSDLKFWPAFDPSHLVVSADGGVVAEDVWVVFLLQLLRKRDPAQIPRLQKAYDSDDDEELETLLEELFQDWELPIVVEMKDHFQMLLDTQYAPISFSGRDFASHPHLQMIANYNSFMRNVFQGAIRYLDLVAKKTSQTLAKDAIKN